MCLHTPSNLFLCVASIKNNFVSIDKEFWNFSGSVSLVRNVFLKEKKLVTESKMKKGLYRVINLNHRGQ